MLSRKVVTRSGRGFRGYFPSKKLSRLVQFESLLERDAIKLFEEAKVVLAYREQPTVVYYYLNDEQRRYYPDFELSLTDDYVVHAEVKPKNQLLKKELMEKYIAIAKHYSSRPEIFVVLTENELRLHNKKDFYQILDFGHLNLQGVIK